MHKASRWFYIFRKTKEKVEPPGPFDSLCEFYILVNSIQNIVDLFGLIIVSGNKLSHMKTIFLYSRNEQEGPKLSLNL